MRKNDLKLTAEKIVIPEKLREKNGVYALTLLGYLVKTLGKPIPVTYKNPQRRTFQWGAKTGNSTGVADVIVTHPSRWPKVWVMIETKRTGGQNLKSQVELVEDDLSVFAVTEEDFVRAVMATEERMGLAVNPKLMNWLEMNRKG